MATGVAANTPNGSGGVSYQTGSGAGNALTEASGVSFQRSVSSSPGSKHPQVSRPGDKVWGADTLVLPRGSLVRDGVPPGQVSATATLEQVRAGIVNDSFRATLAEAARPVQFVSAPEVRSLVVTFANLVRGSLEDSAAPRLLAERPAVVLERIARGGGATRWFRVRSLNDLDMLSTRLSPGSTVSFYFDSRISARPYDDETVSQILDLVSTHGDAVVGAMCSDGLEISVEYIAGLNELGEFVGGLSRGSPLYVGAFPPPDHDARDAVTLTLPDLDGVTREHPR